MPGGATFKVQRHECGPATFKIFTFPAGGARTINFGAHTLWPKFGNFDQKSNVFWPRYFFSLFFPPISFFLSGIFLYFWISDMRHEFHLYLLASVRLWKFKDGGSLKARFLQCGDQVSRISFIFLKWRSTGPQKLTRMSF